MTTVMPRVNKALDIPALAATFARDGRVQINEFLEPEFATYLHRHLQERDDWLQIINSGDKIFELSRAARKAFDADRQARLDDAVDKAARFGFQFRYEALRVDDDISIRAAQHDPLHMFARFLCSEAVLDLLRHIIGAETLNFADAQATAYSAGDFLSAHDDAVTGKNRVAAYVYGLTPAWRPEWGGLLMFHGDDGHISSALTPRFNTLNLFAVPQIHSVSQVTSFANGQRISVTGWLRDTTA